MWVSRTKVAEADGRKEGGDPAITLRRECLTQAKGHVGGDGALQGFACDGDGFPARLQSRAKARRNNWFATPSTNRPASPRLWSPFVGHKSRFVRLLCAGLWST